MESLTAEEKRGCLLRLLVNDIAHLYNILSFLTLEVSIVSSCNYVEMAGVSFHLINKNIVSKRRKK